jgi:trigger factor
MTDETRAEEPGVSTEESQTTALATPEEGEKQQTKLKQTVTMRDTGPCKKHIRVEVDRGDIEGRLNEKFNEMMKDQPVAVAGFRPGKAPRRLIERRFGKEVHDQVKNEVLLASLQQLAEDHDVAPLTSPNLNPADIELPAQGPLVYEFEVEVRPEFDLPNYRGLKLRRPIHTFTDKDIDNEERRLLLQDAQVVPKPEGKAGPDDLVIADVEFKHGDRVIGHLQETTFRVEKQLAFKDGVAPRFAEQVAGANPGEKRVVDINLSELASEPQLRNQTVQATFDIKDVKALRIPELTPEYLSQFGVTSREMLRELIQVVVQRRLEHMQRQSARQQVIEQIAASSSWDLPRDLLQRQAIRSLHRKRLEMEADGIAEAEIQNRLRIMQQDILSSTAMALKEHFVLQKIAEVEKIDVTEADIEDEIERLAAQQGVSPRRYRAQLEREDMLDALMAEMYERRALDLVLDSAEYEDVSLPGTESVEAPAMTSVEAQAVPGELNQPKAEELPGSSPATPE